MFVNLTNHTSKKFSPEMVKAIEELGNGSTTVMDFPFPNVNPSFTDKEVKKLADETVQKVQELTGGDLNVYVLVQGEMSLTYHLVNNLKKEGATPLVACSERNTVEHGNGKKTVQFDFVQFRKY